LATLASYVNIFQNDFAWDDYFFIVDNIHIQEEVKILDYFSEPSTGFLYQPVRSIFYNLHYQIWGLNTFGYPLNGFILNFLISTLVYLLTFKKTGKDKFSIIAGLYIF
jgi:hypothetical protein